MNGDLNWIANFIWGIADDVLRDLYVRGKYRDVILPMTVLRRLDAVLEPTKKAVLDTKSHLDKAKITNQDAALRAASGQAFYNTSKFTLRDLRNRGSQQQLKEDFEAYLDGFSPSVQEILENFEFRNQTPRLSKADALGTLIEKFLDPGLNLSPNPVLNADGSVKYKGLDNHAIGTIFEELVRRFNEENNEEAGEHWTPRDAVKLMSNLIFAPIAEPSEYAKRSVRPDQIRMRFHSQLFRNIVFACEMACDLPWHVVNLVSSTQRRQADEVRYSFAPPTEDVCCYLQSDSQHRFTYRTWEDLHAALIRNYADLERLDQYLRNKSAHYRRAFALH